METDQKQIHVINKDRRLIILSIYCAGIVSRTDDLGRIIIPREVRRKLLINDGDPFEVYYNDDDGTVILRKYYCPEDNLVRSVCSLGKLISDFSDYIGEEKSEIAQAKVKELINILKKENTKENGN
jgi:AbrB family looped-hinge helix DNA binding protein